MQTKTKKEEENRKLDSRLVQMPLEVRLTEKELKTASKLMADAFQKKGQLEAEVETFKADIKAKVKELDEHIVCAAALVNTEKEYRIVECEESFDFEKGLKTTVRLDTGEVVKTDKVTNEERQLFLHPAVAK